mmetsp:Transcript_7184/g.18351  ORF Transcript_7184/g.18351 Transcript_7184/m.18351 type:complete len:215 (+) Transcript_7184:362-1006(+)
MWTMFFEVTATSRVPSGVNCIDLATTFFVANTLFTQSLSSSVTRNRQVPLISEYATHCPFPAIALHPMLVLPCKTATSLVLASTPSPWIWIGCPSLPFMILVSVPLLPSVHPTRQTSTTFLCWQSIRTWQEATPAASHFTRPVMWMLGTSAYVCILSGCLFRKDAESHERSLVSFPPDTMAPPAVEAMVVMSWECGRFLPLNDHWLRSGSVFSK